MNQKDLTSGGPNDQTTTSQQCGTRASRAPSQADGCMGKVGAMLRSCFDFLVPASPASSHRDQIYMSQKKSKGTNNSNFR